MRDILVRAIGMALPQGPPKGPGGAPMGPPDPSMIPSPPSPAARELARAFVGVIVTLNVLAFLVFVGRIWTRSFPTRRLALEDYIIMVTWALMVTDTALLFMAVPFMFGRSPESITLADAQNSQHFAVIAQPIWAWTIAGIKISVILMLLRLQTEKIWRRCLWGLIGFVLVFTVYNMIAQFTQCIPLHKVWDLLGRVEGKCWGPTAVRINIFVTSTVNVVTDFIVALIPITFLRKVQRPLRERTIIGALMALGIFAGVASIVKMVFAAQFGKTGDPSLDGIRVGMWSLIEELVGFIAACVPCLRSPFQRCLEYFGLVSTHAKSSYGRGYGQMYGGDSTGMAGGRSRNTRKSQIQAGVKMKSLRSADAASEENILADGDSGRMEDAKGEGIWCTTDVHVEEEAAARQTPRVGNGMPKGGSGWNDESLSRGPSR